MALTAAQTRFARPQSYQPEVGPPSRMPSSTATVTFSGEIQLPNLKGAHCLRIQRAQRTSGKTWAHWQYQDEKREAHKQRGDGREWAIVGFNRAERSESLEPHHTVLGHRDSGHSTSWKPVVA